jgi:hypothetical protein
MDLYISDDLAQASGPKIHASECHFVLRRKLDATTMVWHGPFKSYPEATERLESIARGHRQDANSDPPCCKPGKNL